MIKVSYMEKWNKVRENFSLFCQNAVDNILTQTNKIKYNLGDLINNESSNQITNTLSARSYLRDIHQKNFKEAKELYCLKSIIDIAAFYLDNEIRFALDECKIEE